MSQKMNECEVQEKAADEEKEEKKKMISDIEKKRERKTEEKQRELSKLFLHEQSAAQIYLEKDTDGEMLGLRDVYRLSLR